MRILSALFAVVFAVSLAGAQPLYAESGDSGARQARRLADGNDIVHFNENSHKYHSPGCAHLKKCTHCIPIKRSEAKARGGVPCKTCGGGE